MFQSHQQQILALKNLVAQTTGDQYRVGIEVLPHSTMGGHVRHILEFFDCFFIGLEQGEIDYKKRKRDLVLEEVPEKACEKCDEMMSKLETLSDQRLDEVIMVWSEMQESSAKLASTVARELEYLFHHMVHHLALIGVYLRSQGVTLGEDFGVAPSTVQFWKNTKTVCAP